MRRVMVIVFIQVNFYNTETYQSILIIQCKVMASRNLRDKYFSFYSFFLLAPTMILLIYTCQGLIIKLKSIPSTRIIINYTMSHKPLYLIVIILLVLPLKGQQNQTKLNHKVVEIEPVALDVIVSQFDRVVVFMVTSQPQSVLTLYQQQSSKLAKQFPDESTLFAICNASQDHSQKLKKYGEPNGIKFINHIHHQQLSSQTLRTDPDHFLTVQYPNLYRKLVEPPLSLLSVEELPKLDVLDSYYVVVKITNDSQSEKTSAIYKRIYEYLQFFNVQMVMSHDSEAKKPSITIFKKGKVQAEYAASAMDQLYNFADGMVKQSQINDLIDFINIETIDEVSVMSEKNYYRVFGSSLETQMLLVYPEEQKDNPQLIKAREQFHKAAIHNKNQQLKYQRVLFGQATTNFLSDYFSEELLTNQHKQQGIIFKIILTKTDYSSFQLRKFEFDSQISSQNIINFMEDVRLKRVKAKYNSEPIPNNKDKKIIKIVGQSFLQEVFEKHKSVVVMFIDSKDSESHKQQYKGLEQFVQKYYEAYQEHLDVGVFDLAKNQHESLTIKTAPELVLFEKTNKKKPKFFKGNYTPQIIKNWVNYEVKDVTIPQNFGEPILPLGPPSDL